MINGYFIRSVNNEEVLYLNFDFGYEFSSFDFMAKRENIQEVVRNFIRNNKIAFRGATVLLVSGGVLFGSVFLNTPSSSTNSLKSTSSSIISNVDTSDVIVLDDGFQVDIIDDVDSTINDNIDKSNLSVKKEIAVQSKGSNSVSFSKNNSVISESNTNNAASVPKIEENVEIKEEISTPIAEVSIKEEDIDNNIYVNVRRGSDVVRIELEEYVIGVVGAEMPAAFNIEALKAQAVIARTYAMKANSRGIVLSDNESSQSYKSNDQLSSLWGNSYNTYFNKIKDAVDSTKGLYLVYNGNYIEAVYHSTSNGRTEDSSNVWGNSYPYLVSVDSPYDNLNPSYLKSVSFSYSDISRMLDVIITSDTTFTINGKTSGDRVSSISVGEITFTGIDFRSKLGLRSADFDIEKNSDGVVITTRGYGHGVGMSQYGANGMAKNGSSYRDILFHYYPGVSIKSEG